MTEPHSLSAMLRALAEEHARMFWSRVHVDANHLLHLSRVLHAAANGAAALEEAVEPPVVHVGGNVVAFRREARHA